MSKKPIVLYPLSWKDIVEICRSLRTNNVSVANNISTIKLRQRKERLANIAEEKEKGGGRGKEGKRECEKRKIRRCIKSIHRGDSCKYLYACTVRTLHTDAYGFRTCTFQCSCTLFPEPNPSKVYKLFRGTRNSGRPCSPCHFTVVTVTNSGDSNNEKEKNVVDDDDNVDDNDRGPVRVEHTAFRGSTNSKRFVR